MTEHVPTVKDVCMRAARIIAERGYAQEYSYKSGAPVDLNRALHLAEKELGYPTSEPCVAELLGESVHMTLGHYGRTLEDEDDAIDFLMGDT